MENNNENVSYTHHVIRESLNKWSKEEPIRRGCTNGMCFCTGRCQDIIGWKDKDGNVTPTPDGTFVFQRNPFIKTEETSHFEDIEEVKTCSHIGHNPPMHLNIPQGKRYIHICPGCKQRTVLQPPQIKF